MIANDKIFARNLEPLPMGRHDDMDKAGALTIQAFLLLGTALISIGGRLYVRCRRSGVKNLGLDDGLAVAGMILFVPNVVLSHLLSTQTQWMGNRSVINGQAEIQTSGVEYYLRELGPELYLYCWLCYSAALWMFKAAFLAFILRRTAEVARRQVHRYLGFSFLVLTYGATTITLLQHCRPLSRFWQAYPDSGQHCQPATSPVLVWVYLGFDIITNFYLAFAAISVAAREGKPRRDKLQWLAALMCGLFAMGAAVARAVILSLYHNLDAEHDAETLAVWQIFTFVAAAGLTEASYQDYSLMRNADDACFKGYPYSSGFSSRRPSLTESGATIIATPGLGELHEKPADLSVEEFLVDGRRNSGIQRKVEISVFQESFTVAPEEPCDICGNYTKSWAHDEDANKPEQRSTYFGGNIHFHVPNYGIIYKERT
ncbi:hypothetical protein M419DRAFT_80603 [Trichoderma reesei RUT C-30]|uniref:Rhodopsin domain-containing protein n=1 Tax=Hypocrea jecorina (strain ATCC 56765 / BCRC 32924 / NRRL 11460 / Rut C-30) TaxID=1344414 RepID=A0A024SAQ2_HYPJR|nr:hypothetical protein M419DRAFT_80603 [Trichoderma reesei RUT C-30]